ERNRERNHGKRRENNQDVHRNTVYRNQRQWPKSDHRRFKTGNDGERHNGDRSFPRQPNQCRRRSRGRKSEKEVKRGATCSVLKPPINTNFVHVYSCTFVVTEILRFHWPPKESPRNTRKTQIKITFWIVT